MTYSFKEAAHNRYEQKVKDTARQLREMAEAIEREGLAVTDRPRSYSSLTPHLWCAERVLHEITWGVANLSAHHLIEVAVDADTIEDEVASR